MTVSSLAQEVIVGVDTHKDVHVAVAIDVNGRRLGERMVPTTEQGCIELHRWALQFAPRVSYGVEGTGSYGAGLSRYLQAQASPVAEIRGPSRKLRRDRGKSDTIDAEAAARAVLAGTSTISPKAGNDWVEQLRMLRVARRSAIQARTQAINQMHAVVVGAPQELRDTLQQLPRHELIKLAARFRVADAEDAPSTVRWTLRLLACAIRLSPTKLPRSTRPSLRYFSSAPPNSWTCLGLVPTSPALSWLSLVTIHNGSAPRRLSQPCAVSHHCLLPRARPPATG